MKHNDPCFKCGAGLMRAKGMHVGLICDSCGAQADFTSSTESGKECQNPNCTPGRCYHVDKPCSHCQGLGWIPAPGDALTANEACQQQGKDVT